MLGTEKQKVFNSPLQGSNYLRTVSPGGDKEKQVLIINKCKREILSTLMKNDLKDTELWHGKSCSCGCGVEDTQSQSPKGC